MTALFSCFATCPKGLEDLLTNEVLASGAKTSKQTVGAIYFDATLEQMYRLCLWSRVANRVFVMLLSSESSIPIEDELSLYNAVRQINWGDHFDSSTTIAVDFIGTNRAINNTQFGAVRVKDAIVDRFRAETGERPSVSKSEPDLRIQVRLNKGRIQVGLDMSGNSLHQRGYRLNQGIAPLKENLAAAILLRAGWPDLAKQHKVFLDPMCGSGTLLLEAALIALDGAPGLWREHYGFLAWKRHRQSVWAQLRDEAANIFNQSCAQIEGYRFYGFDSHFGVIESAKSNIRRLGLTSLVSVEKRDLTAFQNPFDGSETGLVICNPPYGERLGDVEALKETYLKLAKAVKEHCENWQFSVFTGNRELAREMRMRPKKVNKLMNGSIPCELLSYDVLPAAVAELRDEEKKLNKDSLSDGAIMVFNRLQKNQRRMQSWLKKGGIQAYRLYDADLPEYSAAIDVYGNEVCVQEYAPPKKVDEEGRKRRYRELLAATAVFFDRTLSGIHVKTRQKQSGKAQYEKYDTAGNFFTVKEGSAEFNINLNDYLDSGLFLDHRPLRLRLADECTGKRFLNLFCYTATASVHAALGGAIATTSVDMSNTYLDWAERNFKLNRLNLQRNQLVQADCLKWLNQCREGFDVIMLDPPTFSNSKKMDGVLDIQRDHVSLIRRCMDLLLPGGKLYFSNNLRNFKLDEDSLSEFSVSNISDDTIDEDFSRNRKIHQCFLIEKTKRGS